MSDNQTPQYRVSPFATPSWWQMGRDSRIPSTHILLNTTYLINEARAVLQPQRYDLYTKCLLYGFPTFTTLEPRNHIIHNHRVLLHTKQGQAVTDQLIKLKQMGALHTTPPTGPIPGTHTFIANAAIKVKIDPVTFNTKDKFRCTLDGSAPGRKDYVPKVDCQYTTTRIINIMADALYYRVWAGSLLDYEAFFNYLHRHSTQIPSNAIIWDIGQGWQCHYLLTHGFGEAHTPAAADLHGDTLQKIQQRHINHHTLYHHVLHRRVDDTLILHGTVPQITGTSSILRTLEHDAKIAITTFTNVCKLAKQPLQNTKTDETNHISRFDGFDFKWDFHYNHSQHKGAIGYPADKQHKLLPLLTQALSTKSITRKTAESLTSSLEYATQVLYYYRPYLPPIRHSWLRLPHDHIKVTFTPAARSALQKFQSLFQHKRTLYVPFTHFFDDPHGPNIQLWTDASGNRGIGGYACISRSTKATPMFFTTPIQPSWNLHMDTHLAGISSTWLELVGLLYALHTAGTQWRHTSIQWTTDSSPAHNAMHNHNSSTPAINKLLEAIFTHCTRNSIHISTTWVARKFNKGADLLSRLEVQLFLTSYPNYTSHQKQVPKQATIIATSSLLSPHPQ